MTPLDIACDPPPIVPRPRLRHLVGPALAVLLLAGLLLAVLPGTCCCCDARVDVAKLAIARFANEAYPAWRRDNPDRACPFGLGELARYLDKQDLRDPWGRYYQFTCGDDRVYVMSLGEDNQLGTEDDIWSNAGEPR